MADFIFDGTAKTITEPLGSGNTEFTIKRDVYSAWKRWVTTGDGSKFDAAFSVEGGTPIGATGLFTGSTFVLINGWKLKGAAHDHIVTLTGNLFAEDNAPTVPTGGFSVLVNIIASVNAQGIATGSSALTTAQDTKLSELHQLSGLDAANPVTVPKDSGSLTTGAIDITVTDNPNDHTLARQ